MSNRITDARLSREVFADSVVRVDLDQSHCISFDFDDLKVSHLCIPFVVFRFPTDPNSSVSLSCVHNNDRQSERISEDVSTRKNTGQNNQMQGNAQPAGFDMGSGFVRVP